MEIYRQYADELKEKWLANHPEYDLNVCLRSYLMYSLTRVIVSHWLKRPPRRSFPDWWRKTSGRVMFNLSVLDLRSRDMVEGRSKETMVVDYASNHPVTKFVDKFYCVADSAPLAISQILGHGI